MGTWETVSVGAEESALTGHPTPALETESSDLPTRGSPLRKGGGEGLTGPGFSTTLRGLSAHFL